jgi:hypothetical protein
MSVLLKFVRASKIADLPPVAQPYFDDDEEFIDVFAGKDDSEKCEDMAVFLQTCLDANLTDDREIARMVALSILGLEHRYEEKKEEDVPEPEQVVEVPMFSAPAPAPEPVPVPVPEPIPEPAPKKPRAKVDPNAPKRGRGRPPKNPDATAFKCSMCGIGCASSGSLFNHYHSKPHQAKVLAYLETASSLLRPDKKYKILVETRNKAEGRELGLSQLNPDEGTFLDLKDYVGGENPITLVELCEGYDCVYPSGKEYVSWRKV